MKKVIFLKSLCKLLMVLFLVSSCNKQSHNTIGEKMGKVDELQNSTKQNDSTKTTLLPWRPYYSWLKTSDGC
jgi:hypothetical protein